MKKLNTGIILLAMTALLAACGKTPSKQKEIEPDAAKTIAEHIYNHIDEDYAAIETPDKYTLLINSNSKTYQKTATSTFSSDITSSTKLTYSKKANMYYCESSRKEVYKDKTSEYKYIEWSLVEDGVLHSYFLNDEEGKISYYHYSDEEGDLAVYASDKLTLESWDCIYDNLEDCFFSKTAPDMSQTIEGEYTSDYAHYYGSDNADSLQIEESLDLVSEDFASGISHFSGQEKIVTEINIKNFLLYSFLRETVMSQKALDDSLEQCLEFKVDYSLTEKYEKTPSLDKTLFPEAE